MNLARKDQDTFIGCNSKTLTIYFTQRREKMKNDKYFKKCIAFGRAKEGLRADFQQQMREMQREIGFEYVRFHGLFHDDMAVYDEDEQGNPVLWFGYIDKLFDFLLSVQIKPFVELGFMPTQLATVTGTVFWWKANGCPPTSYEKWHFLVQQTVRHFTERYGEEEVRSWYFEVWNEPNLRSFFAGTQEEYFQLYAVTVDAVRSVCPKYRVGGPSTSGADFREDLGYLKEFLRHCSERRIPVDFVSAHPYPTCWALDGDGTKRMGYISKEICTEFFDRIQSVVRASAYPDAEIHLTEWNSSPSPRDLVHDTPFMAPFLLYNLTQNWGKINSLAFWTFSDVFEENGPGLSPFHGGFGLINTDNVRKPAYWAYWLLNKMGDDILEVDGCHMVTRQGQNYQVLVWNYCYYTDAFAEGDRHLLSETSRDMIFQNKDMEIELSLPLKGRYLQTMYCLDQETSAYHNWLKLGAPQYPSPSENEMLRSVSRPKEEHRVVSSFAVHETLHPHEVRCYLLKRLE